MSMPELSDPRPIYGPEVPTTLEAVQNIDAGIKSQQEDGNMINVLGLILARHEVVSNGTDNYREYVRGIGNGPNFVIRELYQGDPLNIFFEPRQ